MNRNKKIEIRLSEEDFAYIESMCKQHSMNKSEFIRSAIRDGSTMKVKDMIPHIFTMQKMVNDMNVFGVTEENLKILTKEMNQLWQFVK